MKQLVTTIGGQIYRVTSSGAATLLASTGEDTEGLDIAPLGVFGPNAGQLFVASEGSGLIRAISPAGVITVTTIGSFPNQPEDGIFVTAAIVNPCPPTQICTSTVSELATLGLLAMALLALGAVTGFRRRPSSLMSV